MPTETEQFLSAEEAVHNLLGHLERLKQEVEGYALAKTTLDDTRTQIGRLTASLTQLAEQSSSIIAALGRIGTPEILSRVDDLRTLNRDLVQKLEATVKDVSDSQRMIAGQMEKTAADHGSKMLGATEQFAAQVASLQETIATSQSQLSDKLKTANQQHVADLGEKVGTFASSIREVVTSSQSLVSDQIQSANKQHAIELAAVQTALERRLKRLMLFVAIGIPTACIIVIGAQWLVHRFGG